MVNTVFITIFVKKTFFLLDQNWRRQDPSWPPGYPTRTRELLNIASYRTSNIIILSAVSFSEAVSEPFSIARSEPSNEQEDAYDIVQAMQEVQLQAHAAPPRPVDTSG